MRSPLASLPRPGAGPFRPVDRSAWRFLSLLTLLLALAPPAEGVEVEVEVGLDEVVVEEAWSSVVVRVTLAPDDAPLDGRVVIERPRDLVGVIEAPVRVAPGQTATVRLVAPPGTSGGLVARVVDQDGTWRAEAPVTRPPTTLTPEERLVLFVGRGLLSVGDQVRRADRPRVARLAPAQLPRDPRVLAAARTIVLTGSAEPDLVDLARDPEAVAALERWVRAGGRLVVLASDRPFWRDTRLDALLPAAVDGAPAVERGGALAATFGRVQGDVPLLAATPRSDAKVVVSGDRWPVLVERELGRGHVVLCLVDVDREVMRGAENADAFVSRLLAAGRAPPPGPRAQDVHDLAKTLLAATPSLGGGWAYLITAAALVQALGVTVLAGWASRRRGPWAGLAAPIAVSLVVATVLLLAGALRHEPPSAQALAVVTTDGGLAGQAHLEVAVFSGVRARLGLDLPGALRPRADLRRAPDPLRLRIGPPRLVVHGPSTLSIEGLEVPPHGVALVGFDGDVVEGERATGELLVGLPRLSVETTTRSGPAGTGWPLVAVRSRERAPLGRLLLLAVGAGGTRIRWIEAMAPEAGLEWDPAKDGVAFVTPTADAARAALESGNDDALLLQAAGLLEASWARSLAASTGADRPEAAAWVLVLDRPAATPLALRDDDGAPLAPPRLVRIGCLASVERRAP
jgi:hypothetical protein